MPELVPGVGVSHRRLPMLGASQAALAEARAPSTLRTALVSMPFVSTLRPSIQLGLLKGIGEQHGFAVDTFHLSLELAAQLGLQTYETLCHHRGPMFGDWLFSVEAFGDQAPDLAAELPRVFERELGELERAALLQAGGFERRARVCAPSWPRWSPTATLATATSTRAIQNTRSAT